MKDRRKKILKFKKNFFPALVITLLLWLLVVFVVGFISPEIFFALPVFLTILFFALFFSFSLIFGNKRRGAIVSFSVIIFLILRLVGVGNILNLILLSGAALVFELHTRNS